MLLTYGEYRRLIGKPRSILDLLAQADTEDIEIELPERKIEPFQDIGAT